MTNVSEKKSLPKKQQAIIDTAESLFQRFGFKRVTVNEICREAKVSKMTFYKYFDNKIALVKTLLMNWTEDGYNYMDQVNTRDIHITEKIRLLQEFKLKATARMSPEFVGELFAEDSGLASFLRETRQKGYQQFMNFLVEAQNKGEMTSKLQPKFIMLILDKMAELFQDKQILSLFPDYVELTREVFDFIFYGLVGKRKDRS
ncbi:MAG: TetR/AcrR family transcriptional regulator [candidate division Zixibacteria bacterium]|nr:TetR/AcrR family transcriptional regulator [candidate division Zixibacteria bacterium]